MDSMDKTTEKIVEYFENSKEYDALFRYVHNKYLKDRCRMPQTENTDLRELSQSFGIKDGSRAMIIIALLEKIDGLGA